MSLLLPSLFYNLVQLLKSTLGQFPARPKLGYASDLCASSRLFLNLNSETTSTVTARLRIVSKQLPLSPMPLHPRCGAHFYEGSMNTHNLFRLTLTEY